MRIVKAAVANTMKAAMATDMRSRTAATQSIKATMSANTTQRRNCIAKMMDAAATIDAKSGIMTAAKTAEGVEKTAEDVGEHAAMTAAVTLAKVVAVAATAQISVIASCMHCASTHGKSATRIPRTRRILILLLVAMRAIIKMM